MQADNANLQSKITSQVWMINAGVVRIRTVRTVRSGTMWAPQDSVSHVIFRGIFLFDLCDQQVMSRAARGTGCVSGRTEFCTGAEKKFLLCG